MVNSISGSTPYSYLDQLSGKAAPTVATSLPDVDSDDNSTSDAANAKAAAALNLPPEVFSLLQSVGSDNTVSSLLNKSNSTNPILQLFGQSTAPSASDIITSADTNVLETGASSGLYTAALNAASTKKATGFSSDYISKVLDAYHAVINQNNPTLNNFSTTG